VIIGKDVQVWHTVAGSGYIGVPPAVFLVQPGFDVATSERNWTRTRCAGWDCRAGGPPQVICSDDDNYERADCRILDCRICLTGVIVEYL
jgi:hypothetical protein